MKTRPHTLICTVGTSLFIPNLNFLPIEETYQKWLEKQPLPEQSLFTFEQIKILKEALENKNWTELSTFLRCSYPGSTRICGAEINSITDIVAKEYVDPNCKLIFCHSETEDGREIGAILKAYFEEKHRVDILEIGDLQDLNPKLFRTKGLRNLARTISKTIRENGGAKYCAINATGGYKAQIAIGVLLGQALGIPVYYKHERFSEIIAFPPMPVSLDFDLWMNKSGFFFAFQRNEEILPKKDFEEDWDEKLEALIQEPEMIDGKEYLELSATGQIFHDTFFEKFDSYRDKILPPSVPENQKKPPKLSDHSWGNARLAILKFMENIINKCPYIKTCYTDYWNPDLPKTSLFRLKGEEIEGTYSNGTWTVKVIAETSAETMGQRNACITDLNIRLQQGEL